MDRRHSKMPPLDKVTDPISFSGKRAQVSGSELALVMLSHVADLGQLSKLAAAQRRPRRVHRQAGSKAVDVS